MTTAIETPMAVRPGTYRIDPARSNIAFRACHVGGLFPFTGSFTIRSGEFTSADSPGGATGSIVIDAASFSTGNSMRDNHVRTWQFLDVSMYPDIVFNLDGAEPDGKGGWHAAGSVLAHGVSHQVPVQVLEVAAEDDAIRIRATASIDRYDFRVGVFPNMAGRRLDFSLDIVAALSKAAAKVAA